MNADDYTAIREALDAIEVGDYSLLDYLTEEQVEWMRRALAYLNDTGGPAAST